MARPSRRHVQHVERLERRTVLASAVAGTGSGLVANYFSDQEFQNLALSRTDATIDFNWGEAAPAAGVPGDHFSVRWSGKIQPQFSETYTFYTQSDEGVALWVNGQPVIDNFTDHTFTEDRGTITLQAGQQYDIRLEYYDNQFNAAMRLLWSSPSTAKQLIPSTQLYADSGWTSGVWQSADVGEPAAPGAFSGNGPTLNVTGAGAGLNGTSDQFQFVYQQLVGDGSLVAQIADAGGGSGEAGLLFRTSNGATSTYAGMFLTPGGANFEYRNLAGEVSTSARAVGGASAPYWLKIERTGDFVKGFVSATGAANSWTLAGMAYVPMAWSLEAGLGVAGGSGITSKTVAFQNVALTGAADDFTDIPQTGDGQVIYVSNSTGNNANSGLSPDAPVKTIAKGVSLLRTGMPDQLLLKRGDVWNEAFPHWTKSGRSASEPMVVSSYGSSNQRPWLKTGTKTGFITGSTPVKYLHVQGLHFEANTRNPDSPDFTGSTAGGYGFQTLSSLDTLLVEDCVFDSFVYNISLQAFYGPAKNVTIRRNIITDAYDPGNKSQGIYASGIDGLVIDGNLIDHNGWSSSAAVTAASNIYSHNVYLFESNRDVVVRNNIIANGSSHGIQARGGGIIENNLFVNNPLAILFGNGSTLTAGGVSGRVTGNVIVGSRDIGGELRGWAIEVGNTKPGANSIVSDNIMVRDSQLNYPAITLEPAVGSTNPSEGVGINDLFIERNTVYQWHQALGFDRTLQPGGSGLNALNRLTIRDNDFQSPAGGPIINHASPFSAAQETWQNNRYSSNAAASGWFTIGTTPTSFNTWKANVEPSAVSQNVAYQDPLRSIELYSGRLGWTPANITSFLSGVRARNVGTWDPQYTALAANAFMWAGFKGPVVGDAPAVAQPAQASPASVAGKTTTLSVRGADAAGESTLIYSWRALNERNGSVTFSANNSNAAKNTTATFTRVGTYQLEVTIFNGTRATSSVATVAVTPTLTSLVLAPQTGYLINGGTQQFSAAGRDQFGAPMSGTPSVTWSVDNGLGTISAGGLFTAPADGTGTAVIRATSTISNTITGTATALIELPRESDLVQDPIGGLDYKYYEGTWSVLPNFDAITPLATGAVPGISLAPKLSADRFGFVFSGYVFAPAQGTYTFYTTSDDGSALYIGERKVVDNDGTHGSRERSGQIALKAGWHAFKVTYFDSTGGDSVTASYAGPGMAKQLIPTANFRRVDIAPTIVNPPEVTQDATGKTANITVLGGDEAGESTLTYTWSTIAVPTGAAAPTFNVNGTNAAKNAVATFSQAGNYQLQVVVSDGVLSTTATLQVTVLQTVTSINISPTSASMLVRRTKQFTAVAKDQFGKDVSNASITWSVQPPGGGEIDGVGLYTAPETPGDYGVIAASGQISAVANVHVEPDAAPVVVTPAAASPNPVTNGATALSVVGDDDSGEANLTYTWEAVGFQPAPVTFSVNGTNGSKNTNATFSAAGNYTLRVTISDGFGSTTSSVDVTVGSAQTNPTVAQNASAAPSPVSGTQTFLSVLGADDGGEANLTYTWVTTGTPPAAVGFSQNGTNAAKNVAANFARAGTYTFTVTISDGSATTTSSVTVAVHQTLTSVTVLPSTAVVQHSATRQFGATAYDQFGLAMTNQPAFAWTLSITGGSGASAGTLSQTGLYTAPASGTPTVSVKATAPGNVNSTATVTVAAATPTDAFGASTDIGGPTLAGSYTLSNGVYTVKASGSDIWNNADQFHYVYKSFSGDGQIIARVNSVQNTHARAKAGVMFRETLAAGSRHVNLELSPDNTIALQHRLNTDGGMFTVGATGTPAPYWLKLVRSGSTFTGYRSPDGVNWQLVGNVSVAMNASIFVGLSLTSHTNAQLNTSTFQNVSVSQSAPLAASRTIAGSSPSTSTATSAAALTDGRNSTYFQARTANGVWVGFDLGSAKTITAVRFVPRAGYSNRMVGGKFQASNSADFSKGVADLFVIQKAPASGAVNAQPVAAGQAYRYVRYVAPDGSFGNVAETAFVGF